MDRGRGNRNYVTYLIIIDQIDLITGEQEFIKILVASLHNKSLYAYGIARFVFTVYKYSL